MVQVLVGAVLPVEDVTVAYRVGHQRDTGPGGELDQAPVADLELGFLAAGVLVPPGDEERLTERAARLEAGLSGEHHRPEQGGRVADGELRGAADLSEHHADEPAGVHACGQRPVDHLLLALDHLVDGQRRSWVVAFGLGVLGDFDLVCDAHGFAPTVRRVRTVVVATE